MQESEIKRQVRETEPKVHCITNYVTMQDVANIVLAAGGSAIMAQDKAETAEITEICQATLLNTGTPDKDKIQACICAGSRANELGHPVILDPAGAGASAFRRNLLRELLSCVKISVIRCNQEEAKTLLDLKRDGLPENENPLIGRNPALLAERPVSGGVESVLCLTEEEAVRLAGAAAQACQCVVLISGEKDIVSDGRNHVILTGGDARIRRITGGGCMLSALCALFCGAAYSANADLRLFDAVCAAGKVWKECTEAAGKKCEEQGGGIGTFHMLLFDMLEQGMKGSRE